MENVYEKIDDEGNVYDTAPIEKQQRADSPAAAPADATYENPGVIYETPAGEVKDEPLYSEVQVHASPEGEEGAVAEEDADKHSDKAAGSSSSSSSSSSDDEEEEEQQGEAAAAAVEAEKVEEKVEEEVAAAEPQPAVVLLVEEEEAPPEVNGDGPGSRRSSSASSASSSSSTPGGDDDDDAPEPEEAVNNSLKALENVTLEEEPKQPEIALFVKNKIPAAVASGTKEQTWLPVVIMESLDAIQFTPSMDKVIVDSASFLFKV